MRKIHEKILKSCFRGSLFRVGVTCLPTAWALIMGQFRSGCWNVQVQCLVCCCCDPLGVPEEISNVAQGEEQCAA